MKQQNCAELELKILEMHYWLKSQKYSGYDPYDLSYLKINKLMTKGYFFKKTYGLIRKIDYNFPEITRLFFKKNRYPLSDCQFGQAYLKLYTIKKKGWQLKLAKQFANKLIKNKTKYWGLPFDWEVPGIQIKKNTACSTVTVPVINFLLDLYEETGIDKYRESANSSIEYLLNNLKITYENNTTLAYSYTPKDNFMIINSNSYLLYLISRTNYTKKSREHNKILKKLLSFIVSEQNEDGSWDYWSKKDPNYLNNNCVDTLHNCYIVQNLILSNKYLKNKKLNLVIKKNIKFLRTKIVLVNDSGYIYKFPNLRIKKISTVDLYELIKTLILYNTNDKLIGTINKYAFDNFYNLSGYFYFEKNNNRLIKQPYIRYVEAPCFLTLMLLLERCYEIK